MGLGETHAEGVEFGEEPPASRHRGKRLKRRTLQNHPVYAAMIENLDHNIGRLLETIDDNTLVIFTSDNGGLSTSPGAVATCNAPLSEGKGWMADGGVRVSQIAYWPDHIPGNSTHCHEPTTTPDWYPTLCHLGETEFPATQHIDGSNITDLLHDKEFERGPIFWHYPHYSGQGGSPGAAVRWGNWKLIEHFENQQMELFNLNDDISEHHNQWTDRPEVGQRLWHALKSWQHDIEAKIPKPNPNWQSSPRPKNVDPQRCKKKNYLM